MRILLLLGETPSSVAARRYAFQLARDVNAELAGLAGVDLTYIDAPMLGGIGTTAYKVQLEEHLKKEAEDARARLRGTFERECEAHAVPLEWLSFDGDPIDTLLLATESRDVVVMGHDIGFHGNIREQLPDMLVKLMFMTPRPLIVCGDGPPGGGDILIAYDGSVPAMRAVQMFALLGFARDRNIRVASVEADQELAARRASGAAGFLRGHGYRVEVIPISTDVHPSEVLRIQVADRRVGLLVMGAYGNRGMRELLFGSTTKSLVEEPPCPLFLYR